MFQKIAVIGNIAGGKTRLSQSLAERYSLPLTHIDRLQFLPDMKMRPLDETRKSLNEVTAQEKWIVDGFGPLDLLEPRLKMADQIIFIDLPIWRHYWWLTKRQIQNLWSTRAELPPGCNERNWEHTQKLYKTVRQIHTKMRPEMLRILERPHYKSKTVIIRDMQTWNQVFRKGLHKS